MHIQPTTLPALPPLTPLEILTVHGCPLDHVEHGLSDLQIAVREAPYRVISNILGIRSARSVSFTVLVNKPRGDVPETT